ETNPCALSSNIPTGSPVCLSRRICPPKGSLESFDTPPIFNAALLATAPCPSARVRNTGLFGEILSKSQRVGNTGGLQTVAIQPRAVTHSPGFALTTRHFTLPCKKTTSAGSAGERNDGVKQKNKRLSAAIKLFIISFQLFMRDSSSEWKVISRVTLQSQNY